MRSGTGLGGQISVLTDPEGRTMTGGFARVTGRGGRSLARDGVADVGRRTTRGKGALDAWDEVRADRDGPFEFEGRPDWPTLRPAVHHPDFELAYTDALELKAVATADLGRVRLGRPIRR